MFTGILSLLILIFNGDLLAITKEAQQPKEKIAANDTNSVSDYKAIWLSCNKGQLIAIRSFVRNKKSFLLTVDPHNLKTYVHETAQLACGIFIREKFSNTLYQKALRQYSKEPFPLRNDGLTRFLQKLPGIVLTSDLCPSEHPFDRTFFRQLEQSTNQRPIPITFFITGSWLKNHAEDFHWLQRLVAEKKIAITWANHTYSHPFQVFWNDPLKMSNYFEENKIHYTEQEIFGLEKALLNNGVVPSIYFRFPGLVSTSLIISQLKQLGLIVVGSDTWLGQGHKIKTGSLILIHGTGNEPEGLERFYRFLDQRKNELLQEKIKFFTLTEALSQEFFNP